jgi:hypothetical protein
MKIKRRENKNSFLYFGIAIVSSTFLFVIFSYKKPSKFCKNELFVISSDSIPKFSLKLNQLKDSLSKDVERFFYETDICDKDINFGLILSTKESINVHVMKDCNSIYRPNTNAFLLFVTQQGQVIYDDFELYEIDSIPNKLLKNFIAHNNDLKIDYSEFENLRDNYCYIGWRLLTPKDSLEKVLLKTQEGFVKIYDEISNKRYKKKLCELNGNELVELKNGFESHLVLDIFPLPPPPPPPPSTIIN